eukprot:m.187942 g.187942  ORF g.187942 m.187942 type:complete len:580 (+) comp17234_c0_seq1:53-1792(+)
MRRTTALAVAATVLLCTLTMASHPDHDEDGSGSGSTPEVTVDTRIGVSDVTTSMPVTKDDTDSEKGPYVDDYTGHEICFNMIDSNCPIHDGCPAKTGCLLLAPTDPRVPLEIDAAGQCCPAHCYGIDELTGEPCEATDKLPDTTNGDTPTSEPDYKVPSDYDSVTGQKLCYVEDLLCPVTNVAHCPAAPSGCTSLHTLHTSGESHLLLEVSNISGLCCPLTCASMTDKDGSLCSWTDHSGHVHTAAAGTGGHVAVDDDSDNSDNKTQVEVCFEASDSCMPPSCGTVPEGCTLVGEPNAPLVRMMDQSCCPEPCVAINTTSGDKCSVTDSVPWITDHNGTTIVIDTVEVHMCVAADSDCDAPPTSCPEAPAGCRNLNSSLLVRREHGGPCCPLGCVAVDADDFQCSVPESKDASSSSTTSTPFPKVTSTTSTIQPSTTTPSGGTVNETDARGHSSKSGNRKTMSALTVVLIFFAVLIVLGVLVMVVVVIHRRSLTQFPQQYRTKLTTEISGGGDGDEEDAEDITDAYSAASSARMNPVYNPTCLAPHPIDPNGDIGVFGSENDYHMTRTGGGGYHDESLA